MVEIMEARMNKVEERMAQVEKNLGVFGAYLEGAQKTQERLSTALDGLTEVINETRLTLVSMKGDLNNNVASIVDLKSDLVTMEKSFDGKLDGVRTSIGREIEDVKCEVKTVKDTVQTVDNKSKIDMLSILQKYAPSFMVGGGLAYILSLLMQALSRKP